MEGTVYNEATYEARGTESQAHLPLNLLRVKHLNAALVVMATSHLTVLEVFMLL